MLGREFDVPAFTNIAGSETRRHDAVAGCLDTYGIDESTCTDIDQVHRNLLEGSRQHLEAFIWH